MRIESWAEGVSRHRRAVGLLALLLAFTGLSLLVNPSHAADLLVVGVIFLTIGGTLLAALMWPTATPEKEGRPRSLGAWLINRLAWQGRLVRCFPAFGAGLVISDLGYNMLLSAQPALLTEDVLVLLSACALMLYGLVPPKYGRQRDFAILFFFFLDMLLVVPLLIARLATDNVGASVDIYSWTALAPELGAILSALGVANSVHAVAGSTAPGLTFTPVHVGVPVTVVITTACSGIYSFGIFASAFLAFLTTEYTAPSRRLWLLLGLGFAASYFANLLRMTVIVLVGYYTDTVASNLQNLLLAHSYAGWAIFLGWLALFWGGLFKFLPPERAEPPDPEEPADRLARIQRNVCGICRDTLTPAIPATRCACGSLYHRACLASVPECPRCHSKAAQPLASMAEGN